MPAGPGIADVVVAQEIFDLLRRLAVDEEPAPYLGLVRAARMPDGDRARLARQQRDIGEDFAGAPSSRASSPRGAAPLFFAMRGNIRTTTGECW